MGWAFQNSIHLRIYYTAATKKNGLRIPRSGFKNRVSAICSAENKKYTISVPYAGQKHCRIEWIGKKQWNCMSNSAINGTA